MSDPVYYNSDDDDDDDDEDDYEPPPVHEKAVLEEEEDDTLPQYVILHKKSRKYYAQFSRGGKPYTSPTSSDVKWLMKWMQEKNKELDDDGVPPARVLKKRQPAAFQSKTPGVSWASNERKWTGAMHDRLTRKNSSTSPTYFDDEEECK